MQVCNTVDAGQVTSGGTSVTTFSDVPARLVVFYAPAGNSGTITITKPGGGFGLVLAAGATSPTFWVSNLNAFAYIASSGGDKINYVITR